MKLVQVQHPLVKHKLGLMRSAEINTKKIPRISNRSRQFINIRGYR
ncbi:uracil phosphoribosyltransferase [Pasteurella multocida]|nr:uracil phosphoribosyltransferase [Pasteurella multocida]